MNILYNFIYILVSFTLFIKIIFALLLLYHIYLSKIKKDDPYINKLDSEILYWKNKIEFIFQICIAILLIIVFNPFYNFNKYINHHMKILFFIFGIITILTSISII
jgi:hypothetical protein